MQMQNVLNHVSDRSPWHMQKKNDKSFHHSVHGGYCAISFTAICLQRFDAVGWAAGRASGL